MKLLLDNNLSHRIATALAALFPDYEIVALREAFRANATDLEWMGELDRRGGWSVLTRDFKINTRPHERAALDRARIVFFFVGSGWKAFDVPETAARLIRLVPKMAAQADLVDQGRFELPVNAGSKLRPFRV